MNTTKTDKIPDEIMREAQRLAYNCHPTEIARALMARDKRAAELARGYSFQACDSRESIATAILTYGGSDEQR